MATEHVDDEIDRLYGLPLAEFTRERDEIARRLRSVGDKQRAAEVAALKKPVLAAWAVNRLVRTHRKDVEALVGAAAAIRQGKEDADERFRETLERLTKAVRHVLAESGREPTDTVVRDVATTLRSAAAAEPEALVHGLLTQPVETSGFAAMAGAVVTPPRPAGKAARPRRDAAQLSRLRKALRAARDDARRLRREAERAERAAKDARGKADDADRRVEAAAQALSDAQEG